MKAAKTTFPALLAARPLGVPFLVLAVAVILAARLLGSLFFTVAAAAAHSTGSVALGVLTFVALLGGAYLAVTRLVAHFDV